MENSLEISTAVHRNLLGDWMTDFSGDVATLLAVPNYRCKNFFSSIFFSFYFSGF
jgi:hypothetical protein